MRKYLLPSILILAFASVFSYAQNYTKSVQLSQSSSGPILVDTNNNVWFPAGILGNYTSKVAAPGTNRAITGAAAIGPTAMTSGNLVGVRGSLSVPSGSTSGNAADYLYGVQGKFIGGGTITDGNLCGLCGQVDASAGTYTAGVLSGLWVDMGASASASAQSTSFGGASQLIRLTNTTNAGAALTSQIFDIYANSNLFMQIGAPASTVNYFQSTTTSCGSGGAVTAAKALAITVNGVNYFIPLCATK